MYPVYEPIRKDVNCEEVDVAFPPQQQDCQPGREYLMEPAPISINPHVKGSGRLADRVALITGGDSGIGRAVACAFAREGADVAIAYYNEHEDAEETRQAVERYGRKCLLLPGDLKCEETARAVVDRMVDCFGRLDCLVNNHAVQFLQKSILDITEEQLSNMVEKRLRDEIRRGVQTIQYQVVTLLTTNGQAPFVTVFMYLNEAKNEQEKHDLALIIEEVLQQRYEGVKNESGVWVTPAFPKLIYVLEEDNIYENSEYYYLTRMAAKCTAKRMVPDYISEKKMLELKVDKNGEGHCYTCMGCRSFLTPYVDENGKPKYYGRFNQGVVTINLVDVALSSGGNLEKFWKIFDERLELCHRALMCRHNRLKGTLSDAAPILWQYGACARLKKGETIDKLLYGGYSTISLGYAGLYECVKYMTGKSHTDPSATPFALEIMQYMNTACKKWKEEHNIDFSLYGTPLESTTYKFAKCLQKRFGIIEGVTDKSYITNSYHVHVTEEINAFDKLKFEAQFQHLSPGGAISYVEVPNMQQNLEAVLQVMRFIYDNIIYAELNTKSDYCQVCGWDGEIEIVEQDGKLIWRCPKCGNTDQDKMNVARRTCGYIGTQFWNQGRTQEIKERVLHL